MSTALTDPELYERDFHHSADQILDPDFWPERAAP
jgi:hypothetical protein